MLSFSIGPLVLTPQRLFLMAGFCVALFVGWLHGRRHRMSVEPIITRMLLAGLVGARLGFVLRYFSEYRNDLWRMIDIRDGGFMYEAGLLTATLVGLYYGWRGVETRKTLGIAVAAGVMTWGLAMSGFYSIPRVQPDITALPLTALDGQPAPSLQPDGRPVVVNLWATWCPPCRREMPVLAAAQQQHDNIRFVFMNQGEAGNTVSDYLRRSELALRDVFLDPASAWSRQMGAGAMPTTLFFDDSGNLVDAHTGELSAASLKQGLDRLDARN